MRVVTVLGAGAMGAAFCTPLADAGLQVRLWGTRFDDDLLDECAKGFPHPRTTAPLPPRTQIYRAHQLSQAIRGADTVVISVASKFVLDVVRETLPDLAGVKRILITSKGLVEWENGGIKLLTEAVAALGVESGYRLPVIVPVAGPAIATECAHRKPTAAVVASNVPGVAEKIAATLNTKNYRAQACDDEYGVEICASMKNVYAIALGIADGLGQSTGTPHNNLKAAIFTQAVKEMAIIGEALGGGRETAYGLAGVGDLEVTGSAGRNQKFGMRLGLGQSTAEALKEMNRLGQTVEGLGTTHLAALLAQRLNIADKLPLLNVCQQIATGKCVDVSAELVANVMP